jgi:hypothetical protein
MWGGFEADGTVKKSKKALDERVMGEYLTLRLYNQLVTYDE